ncbi:MAG TPA: hypothetical protein VL049_09490 [Candidatus Dormibacteraeota bacterium]|nr:hypothetical protein [Candidatus Dormibacteraeota bacterium]
MPILLALVVSAALAAPVPVCVGDCSGDDAVAINELIVGVGIALGSASVAACPALDANHDGTVAISELVSGVNNALDGCMDAGTPTGSPSTPTVTPTPAMGPDILFFGVTNADDSYQPSTATDPHGIPIYERPFGFGFSLVVEARHGSDNRQVAGTTFIEGGVPDLQVQATRPLGDGSPAVCDGAAPTFGGVPAVDPPRLDDPEAIADPLNDFGCRFIDGQGNTVGRICQLGCVHFESGDYGCQMGDDTEIQFCAPVSMPLSFPSGDTLVTARVRDQAGNLGPPAQLLVRITPQ